MTVTGVSIRNAAKCAVTHAATVVCVYFAAACGSGGQAVQQGQSGAPTGGASAGGPSAGGASAGGMPAKGGASAVAGTLPTGTEAPGNANGENPDLLAVGLVRSCSAAAIDVGGDDAAPAYILSAGHCSGAAYWQPNEIFTAVQGAALGVFSVNNFWDTDSPIQFPIAAIEYSTMHLLDVSILRLAVTVGELRQRGVQPFPIAGEVPPPGSPITAVGHPLGGVLKRSHCSQGKPTRIAEDEFLSLTIANDCPGILGGSSGSAVRNAAGEVFGVISTSPEGTDSACTLGNPCEVEASDLGGSPQTVYAAQVAGLAGCFSSGEFDVGAPACILPLPPMPNPQRGIGRYARSAPDGVAVRWDVSVADANFAYYRFKTGPVAITRCDEDSGYGQVFSATSNPTITAEVSRKPGLQVLCVHAGATEHISTFSPLKCAAALLTQLSDS